MSVNAIRKQSTEDEVTSLAKSLIKSWKKLLGKCNQEIILAFYLNLYVSQKVCILSISHKFSLHFYSLVELPIFLLIKRS